MIKDNKRNNTALTLNDSLIPSSSLKQFQSSSGIKHCITIQVLPGYELNTDVNMIKGL